MKDLSEKQKEEMRKKMSEMEEKIAQQMQQFIEQKDAGWFQRFGALIGEGIDNTVGELKEAILEFSESCKIM